MALTRHHCAACGWRPFTDLRPGEVAGTFDELAPCPNCGGTIEATTLDIELVPAQPFAIPERATEGGGDDG